MAELRRSFRLGGQLTLQQASGALEWGWEMECLLWYKREYGTTYRLDMQKRELAANPLYCLIHSTAHKSQALHLLPKEEPEQVPGVDLAETRQA